MPSLNQSVSLLAERVGRPLDVPFQEELKVLIKSVGARFTKDALTKRPQDRKYFLQSFNAELIQVSLIDCPINYGCTLRTKLKVPKPLRSNAVLFDYVGSADFTSPFSPGGGWKETFFKHNKYTATKTRYLYKDQYIFIHDEDNVIEYIGVEGIFEDFKALLPFKCNVKCDLDDDEEYPISADILDMVYISLLQNQLRVLPDNKNIEVKVNE
jgi:hypothetical protein